MTLDRETDIEHKIFGQYRLVCMRCKTYECETEIVSAIDVFLMEAPEGFCAPGLHLCDVTSLQHSLITS